MRDKVRDGKRDGDLESERVDASQEARQKQSP